MSRPSLYARGLDLFIAASRVSPLAWISVLLILACAVAQAWWLRELRGERDVLTVRLEVLRRSGHRAVIASASRPSASVRRLGEFQGVLGDGNHQEELIRTLFTIARRSDLVLAESDYSSAMDKSGMYETLQISQPVHGSYAQVRAYCEQTLAALPFAALEGLQFKREGIASAVGEAKLRWMFYLRPAQSVEAASRRER